jgi:cell division septation protein DedD
VRAGPYADRAGAENARATIKQKLQTDGMIVTQP